MSKCHSSKLPLPFGAFRAKKDQCFSVSGSERECLKLKCKGTAVNLKLDHCQRSIVVKKDYITESQQPLFYAFAINIFVKSGSGTVHVVRDGTSIGNVVISSSGKAFIGTDVFIQQPVLRGTKFSLCFQSSSSEKFKVTVKDGMIALTT